MIELLRLLDSWHYIFILQETLHKKKHIDEAREITKRVKPWNDVSTRENLKHEAMLTLSSEKNIERLINIVLFHP